MWHCPKSAVHQAAIDLMKPERDREAAQAMAAQMKLRRAREAEQALKESEIGSPFSQRRLVYVPPRLALAADAKIKKLPR